MREHPLILVASADPVLVESVVASLTAAGYATAVARSVQGCLRVATASGPDVVLLDDRLSLRTERLLRAHPVSRQARMLRLEPRALQALCAAAAAATPAPIAA
jgi:CheY-like chemotaxis protein